MIKYFLIFSILIINSSFSIPAGIVKKADKVIAKFYDVENFKKEVIRIPQEINELTKSEFGDENFFKITSENTFLGYGYIGSGRSKAATFDYLVLFDSELVITKSKVLVYREEYGGEISSKRWLKQFDGKSTKSDELRYNEDIIPISGATISVRAMTQSMNDLLKSLALIEQKNIL